MNSTTKRLAGCLAAIMLASSTPALAWTLNDEGLLPFISQPDHSGQYELKMVCDGLMGGYWLSLTTNETWSDAKTYPPETLLGFEVGGKAHSDYAFAVSRGYNGLLGSFAVEMTMYEGAPGWGQIATALPIAKGTIAVRYAGQVIQFEVENYNDALWELHDSCNS